MSESKPARPKGRRRLVAACTAGILSLGAFALSTGAQAAEPGAHHVAERPTAAAAHVPHIAAPTTSVKKSKLAADAAAQTPAPVRYDIDGDGFGDQLYRGIDNNWYNSLATTNVKLGTSAQQYVDVITPGNIDGAPGPDVLGLTASGKLVMFSGTDFPNYSSWISSGWTMYNKVFAVDDVTGDGIPDIAARTFDGHLYLFPGHGNGGAPFTTRLLIGGGWAVYDQLTSPGDLDGDGISDLVARDTSGNLYLYKATGNASAPYRGKVLIGTGWNTYNQIIGLGNGESGTGYVTGRSFNGDLYQYAPTGTGGLKPRYLWSEGAGTVDVMAGMGGIQNWGKKWLLGVTSSGSLYGYVPTNTGTFYSRGAASDPNDFAGISNFALGVSPTDSGDAELLFGYDGTLYNASRGAVRITTGWSYGLMVGPGDLSGDGKSDLLARNSSGQLYLFKGTGTGTGYTGRTLVSSGWNAYNAIIGAGDMSGDGRTDILARSTDGTLYLFKGTGNAKAPFAGRIKLSSGFGGYNKIATAGDIDGNGLADLLAVKASTGTLYRFSAYGTGQFAAGVPLGNGWNTYSKLF
ncbi:FG-GAP repeat domain-containing protein [Streptomyces sp. NPDC049040]|uniref:FG-GAP repeat domain-containing protein n=1 Tax=Streptomyces sp. NPDC049040 TaxID=3365593 RepID=UPI003718B0D0